MATIVHPTPGRGVRFLQYIVKNDSMKQDSPEIYGWRVFMLACSACFGGMLFGMDIGTIGGVLTLPAFMHKVGQADLSAKIASTVWGRRPALMLAGIITCIGCVFQAAAEGQISVIYIGRFIAGVGVGGASMAVPLYISENAPRAIRGGLTGIYQLFIATGTMLAYWVNYGSILHLHGPSTYIVPLTMQALPAILLFTCMALNKGSPRFLAKADQWDQATACLTRVRNLPADHPYIRAELSDMADSLHDLLREMWTIPGNRKRALISIGLMICQQMTGTNAINYYAPQIFKNLGVVGTSTNLLTTGIYGVTSLAQGTAMYYIGLYVRIKPPVEGAEVPPAGYVALVCIFLFAAFFQFGWSLVCWIYMSEIPTVRLRNLNVAIAAATQWLFNFVVARATPDMLATVGSHGYGTFLIYGSFCFAMFFFVWVLIPETKGLSLERMDEFFGIAELVEHLEGDRELHGDSHSRPAARVVLRDDDAGAENERKGTV
ncbi:general substrate transporter [Lophium mytilinum]|uniref:General substrate transporter n=1 Tax=Lophium mytilinum TaxID=390894 RepID=A0A6A6RBB1_9PEZI|nr:general substrate transporter [Lophium mytilinum]